jgi:hypothetical protein
MSTLPNPIEIIDTDITIDKNISNISNFPMDDAVLRQKAKEQQVISNREKEMRDNWEGLRLIGRGTSVKKAQSKIAEWYFPVAEMLELEKSLINARVPGEDRNVIFDIFFDVLH